MKKLFAFLAVVAAASVAQAYVYAWDVTITDVPAEWQTPLDLTALLVDKSTQQVYAWATLSELKASKTGTMWTLNEDQSEYDAKAYLHELGLPTSAAPYETGYPDAANVAHTPDSIVLTHSLDQETGAGYFKMTMSFETEATLFDYWKAEYDKDLHPTGTIEELETIVFATNEDRNLSYQILQANYSDTSTITSAMSFAPIPEPTTGMLVLMGLAGLALKRKHV